MWGGRLGKGHDRRVNWTRTTDVRGQRQALPLREALKSHPVSERMTVLIPWVPSVSLTSALNEGKQSGNVARLKILGGRVILEFRLGEDFFV